MRTKCAVMPAQDLRLRTSRSIAPPPARLLHCTFQPDIRQPKGPDLRPAFIPKPRRPRPSVVDASSWGMVPEKVRTNVCDELTPFCLIAIYWHRSCCFLPFNGTE